MNEGAWAIASAWAYVCAVVCGRWTVGGCREKESRGLGMLSVAASLLGTHRQGWRGYSQIIGCHRQSRLLSIAGGWTGRGLFNGTPIITTLARCVLRTSCCHSQLALGGCATALLLICLSETRRHSL